MNQFVWINRPYDASIFRALTRWPFREWRKHSFDANTPLTQTPLRLLPTSLMRSLFIHRFSRDHPFDRRNHLHDERTFFYTLNDNHAPSNPTHDCFIFLSSSLRYSPIIRSATRAVILLKHWFVIALHCIRPPPHANTLSPKNIIFVRARIIFLHQTSYTYPFIPFTLSLPTRAVQQLSARCVHEDSCLSRSFAAHSFSFTLIHPLRSLYIFPSFPPCPPTRYLGLTITITIPITMPLPLFLASARNLSQSPTLPIRALPRSSYHYPYHYSPPIISGNCS